MKYQILSDLHLEFFEENEAFIFLGRVLCPQKADGLIIAGDLCSYNKISKYLEYICDVFLKKFVFYIPGNHEYYHSSFDEVAYVRNSLRGELFGPKSKLICSTLWFPYNTATHLQEKRLNDFNFIKDFRKRVYDINETSVKFLSETIDNNSIVVTHHAPSFKSVHKKYKNDPLNVFFVCDMEKIILEKKPKLWIHGHTHYSCDYMIGETRILCNPYGYHNYEINTEFNSQLIVEV